MSEHTPIPWKAHSRYAEILSGLDRNGCVAVFRDSGLITKAEAMANRDFVLRACNSHDDLLAALELAEQGSEGLCPVCLEWYEEHGSDCKLKAAIDKAHDVVST